jgi:hypothetical protein
MTRLTAQKKTRKKQSEFQKLWAKAEKLKQENARFRDRLDGIMQRIGTEIRPVEEETARLQMPLLKCLLTLGQRKSLTQWQRQMLDSWVREILEPLQSTPHLNSEIMDDLVRYDAFRLGFELDEDSSTPVAEQLQAHIEREDTLLEEEFEAEDETWREATRSKIEKILDQTFGPEPPRPEHFDEATADLFQDELKQEQQRAYEAYHEDRNAARKDLLEEMLDDSAPEEDFFDSDFDSDFDFDPFGFSGPFSNEKEDSAPTISNSVFKRLFRSTAAQLHPDREHDPDMREKKHGLMTTLLNARKQGDVMTIIQMHQQHVGDENALSKADEKQLIKALKAQVDELRHERETYTFESPFHRMAFEVFYCPSQKKTDLAFKKHIQKMEKTASEAQALSQSIKSIKTLKPHLEQRYDERRIVSPLEALEALFGSAR